VDLLHRPWGLVLVTGPAGHGKTTSCAALLDAINRTSTKHIVTVEDPLEYKHAPLKSLIDHQEVGSDTPSFAAALKQVVRHNPDVILIGEMRDRASMEAALNVAETGHLVLTTMHANDSVQALDRIASFFPRDQQPYLWSQLSLCLAAVVNQRLIPGTKGGRVLAAEILVNSHAVSKQIREGRSAQLYSNLESERAAGSQSLNAALKGLVDAGRLHPAVARAQLNPHESNLLDAPKT
jgi:twitching motility protein PilT